MKSCRAMLVDLSWLLGVLTLALLSPGPDFLVVVKNSVGGTRRHGLATALGISAGLCIHVAVIALGFATVPPRVRLVVQVLGGVFLGYLGLRALFARSSGADRDARRHPPSPRSGFAEGFLVNLSNPKAFLFFLSLFAQVIGPDSSLAWRIIVPAAIVLHGCVLWSLVVLALQSPPVARRLTRAQHWLPQAFGGALILLAVFVLFEALPQ